MANSNPSCTSRSFAFRRGHQLGVDLISQLGDVDRADEAHHESFYQPERSALLATIEQARRIGTEAEIGLYAMLTDVLASACHGGEADPMFYEWSRFSAWRIEVAKERGLEVSHG